MQTAFVCDTCSSKFLSKLGIQRHVSSHSSKSYHTENKFRQQADILDLSSQKQRIVQANQNSQMSQSLEGYRALRGQVNTISPEKIQTHVLGRQGSAGQKLAVLQAKYQESYPKPNAVTKPTALQSSSQPIQSSEVVMRQSVKMAKPLVFLEPATPTKQQPYLSAVKPLLVQSREAGLAVSRSNQKSKAPVLLLRSVERKEPAGFAKLVPLQTLKSEQVEVVRPRGDQMSIKALHQMLHHGVGTPSKQQAGSNQLRTGKSKGKILIKRHKRLVNLQGQKVDSISQIGKEEIGSLRQVVSPLGDNQDSFMQILDKIDEKPAAIAATVVVPRANQVVLNQQRAAFDDGKVEGPKRNPVYLQNRPRQKQPVVLQQVQKCEQGFSPNRKKLIIFNKQSTPVTQQIPISYEQYQDRQESTPALEGLIKYQPRLNPIVTEDNDAGYPRYESSVARTAIKLQPTVGLFQSTVYSPKKLVVNLESSVGRQKVNFKDQQEYDLGYQHPNSKRIPLKMNEAVSWQAEKVNFQVQQKRGQIPLPYQSKQAGFETLPKQAKQAKPLQEQQLRRMDLPYHRHQGGRCTHCPGRAQFVAYSKVDSEPQIEGITFCKDCIRKFNNSHEYDKCKFCLDQLACADSRPHKFLECELCHDLWRFALPHDPACQRCRAMACRFVPVVQPVFGIMNPVYSGVDHLMNPHPAVLCSSCQNIWAHHLEEEHDLDDCRFCTLQVQAHLSGGHQSQGCPVCRRLFIVHQMKPHPQANCSLCQTLHQQEDEIDVLEYGEEDTDHYKASSVGEISERLEQAVQGYFLERTGRQAKRSEVNLVLMRLSQRLESEQDVDLQELVQSFIGSGGQI